jgi:ribose transport system substrate-binding protein
LPQTANALSKNAWIAVISKGSTVNYWQLIHEGARRAGNGLGVRVVWLEPTSTLTQAKIIDDCVAKHVSGIVIAPVSNKDLLGPVKKASSAGIPVVLIDTSLKGAPVASTIATDNFRAGSLAGQRTVELLNGKGSVVLMRFSKEAENTTEREDGFLDTVRDSSVKILSDNYYGGSTLTTAKQTARRLITELNLNHRAGVAVVTVSASSTEAMLIELEASHIAGRVKFVGFDTSDKVIKGLRDHEIDALVVQSPQQIGYLGVKMMVTTLQKGFIDPEVKTDCMLVDRENIDSPSVKAFLASPAGP